MSVALFRGIFLAVTIASASSAIGQASPDSSAAPCGGELCSFKMPEDARRLNEAYFSDATDDAQRKKMREIITGHTFGTQVDWTAAAKEYFDWRSAAVGFVQAPAGEPSLMRDAEQSERDKQRAFRIAAEAAVRARLVDPDSAEFEWPYKFVNGYWKPFLAKRVEGYVTCGTVNARNRMGGYAGRSAFVVVLSADRTPLLVEMDSGADKYPMIEPQCEKAAASFLPPADPDDDLAKVATAQTSIADELEKLAALRDRGVLTQAEFEQQKAKLLGESK